MLKRLFLVQFLMVSIWIPLFAFAVEEEPSSGNPGVSVVREGSLCDDSTLGVSEDGARAKLRAIWFSNEYTWPAGQYLAVSDESAEYAICPKDSYCPGAESYEFDESDSEAKRGRFLCDTGFHTDSTGSTSMQDCYKSETVMCSAKNPYTTEHMISVNYSSVNAICTQRQGAEAVCDSSCDITGLVCDSGYESRQVDGVWLCAEESMVCEPGTYLSSATQECEVCPENHFCSGGRYDLANSEDLGIESCSDNLKSPSGARSDKDCGIIFHIGDDPLYLHADKRNTGNPSFVIQDGKGRKWYANTEPVGEGRVNAKPVSEGATKELHIMVDGKEYTVHTSLYE